MLLAVALGAGAVGYFLGRSQAPAPVPRPVPRQAAILEDQLWEEPVDPYADSPTTGDEETVAPAAAEKDKAGNEEALPPSRLIDTLRAQAGSPRSQQILIGMVADAARLGGPVLADIKNLLDSGVDLTFASYRGKPGEFPTLRTALLAAAEASGDPAAMEMIQEVAQTSKSTVEVVYSAHLLDRLDALDPETAQRTLESLSRPLSPDEKKALGSIVGRVIPEAARANPDYAENFLRTQLHTPLGTGANPRYVIPALDGLAAERARDVVMGSLASEDVDERVKRALAGRAAQRQELGMLTELRTAIESNILSPRISASIAHSAMSGRRYYAYSRQARQALRHGDLDKARQVAEQFHQRLLEATRTVDAARNAGARLSPKLDTIAKLNSQTLDQVRAQIRRQIDKRRRQQERAAKRAKQAKHAG